MTEASYKSRHRIEVSTSVKGIHTYSCTVELVDATREQVLEESAKLTAALDAKYPAPTEK